VAVARADEILAAARDDNLHGQAEILLPLVEKAMRGAALLPPALDIIVATVGPGSFTGIRAGLAAARGIALSTGARLVGVSSFAAVAAESAQREFSDAHFLLVALESRREDLYIQFFDPLRKAITAPAAILPPALGDVVRGTIGGAPLLIAGDAAQRAAVALSPCGNAIVLTNAPLTALGASRAALCDLRQGDAPHETRPLYLRAPDIRPPAARPI
jgi:tRNA threonylcarbamoyladenosine biosynthesis protein TsaB